MFKNYIKIAFRNLWNNKVFSTINIIGLAIGLSASFVIGLMVYYDVTFDKFHMDNNRIYRVTTDFTLSEGDFYNRGVAVPLGNALKEDMTNIEQVSTFYNTYIDKIKNENTGSVFKEIDDIIYADKSYFQLFVYKWLAGSPSEVLSNPKEVVLTKTRASKYFPNLSPTEILGKTLIYNDSVTITVVGIVNNFEKRSDFTFQEFISFKTAVSFNMKDQVYNNEWNNTNSAFQVFVKLIDNKKNPLQEQLNKLAKEHQDKQAIAHGQSRKFSLQPLDDIHFNSNYGVFDSSSDQASKKVLVSLGFIALFLLLLACINFINLNTANATKRAKEIGIRKTLGSSKKQLVFQFLGEAFLLTITAALVSLFFSFWLLSIFSDFIPKNLNFELFSDPVIVSLMVILLLIVALLSGFYPALVLSHFKPIGVMKNQILQGKNKSSLRKYLTVFQFVIAQVFILATLLVGQQINYLMTKDMGFKTEAIASVKTPWNDDSIIKRITFVEEIKKLPQITNISLGGNAPASFSTHSTITTYFDDEKEIHTSLQLLYGDENYLNLYDIKLLAGRKHINDTIREYVINETYSKILGFENPQEAVGQILVIDNHRNPIVGVMEDFNQRSLKSGIKPMAFIGDWSRNKHSRFKTVHFSLQARNTAAWPTAIAQIENSWKSIYPDSDVRLNFMDESVKKFYKQERKMSVLLNWATGLSILISCLGLLGLVIYTTERRTKEIGIRKVLGASLLELNLLLSKEFLVLVGIAFTIAAPIAWWAMNRWLQGFAYKANLNWWVFIVSGFAMLIIALATVSIRTISSANANPVKSLQTE